MKSICRKESTWERTTRANATQPVAVRTRITLTRLGPVIAAMQIARSVNGSASCTSTQVMNT